MEISISLTVPPTLMRVWEELPPDAQQRLMQTAQETFVIGLRLIQEGLNAPQRGHQPCAE
jgi:hypothetical protein